MPKQTNVYVLLTSLVVCGLAACLITGSKITYLGVNFPFSNLIFAVFTYPIVDCICEIWGKKAAQQALWIGLGCQVLFAALIHLSILSPASDLWLNQSQYAATLNTSTNVLVASIIAFSLSQLLDITVYQRIKEKTQGRHLWLRTNVSTVLGQLLDSILFVGIVYHDLSSISVVIMGSFLVKSVVSFLMTPVVYGIVFLVNTYLGGKTSAFNGKESFVTR